MEKLYKIIFVILAGVILCAAFVGCAKKEQVLRINEVTHSVFYTPMYVAMALGYYEEAGFSVELTNGGGSDKSMTALLSGQADVALLGPETAAYVYNEGKEDYAQIVGQLTKRDGSFLMGREPDDNFTWEKLKGARIIAGRKGGMPETSLEYAIKKAGLDIEKDVTLDTSTAFNLMGGAFEAGEGDYVALFEPTASMFEAANKGHVVASIGEASGEVPFTAFIAIKSYIEKNQSTIQRFIDATYKAQLWVDKASPEEIAEAIVQYFPDTSAESLAATAKRYKEVDAWVKDPVMTESAFNHLQDVLQEAGVLDKRADYSKIVNNSFAEKSIKNVK